jgi:uncharacterized membrane protein YphA (DoxX/SURF4 family)
MHPLSMFPALLSWGLLAPVLLRLAVGLFIAYLGWERYQKEFKWASVLYVVFGILLLVGLYTQITALLSILLITSDYFLDKGNRTFSTEKRILFVVVKVILLTLIITGPGLFAMDLPL